MSTMQILKSIESIDISTLSRTDLIIRYNTGQDSTTGYGKDRIHHYRSGYMTDIGDIEEDDWKQLAEALVAREDGEAELREIIAKVEARCAWLHTDAARREYALQLYMRKPRKNGDCND